MILTDFDKRMLDGGQGPVRQKAMELIVRYARIVGAERLCSVTWADLFCGCHAYLDVAGSIDFDRLFSTMAICSPDLVRLDTMDRQCVCYSGVEADCTEVPEAMIMSSDKQALNLAFLSRFVAAGVILSGNCIPYLTGFIPLMGEHFVSCESSAVLFMNSMWGACGNGDGIEASFCAAVCGRTPLAGKHLPRNRHGTMAVQLQVAPQTIHDWDLLGHTIGTRLPAHAVPVLQGTFARPNAIQLKSFFAALACSAGTEMCHLVGITPEARDLAAAMGGRARYETLVITGKEIEATLEGLNGNGRQKIEYITLGCPHYHIEELRRVAAFLEGKVIHTDTQVDIWTTGPFKYMAERCGYAQTIAKAGARLLTGSCPSSRGYGRQYATVAYDSAKQRYAANQETSARLFYGSRQECLASAISGFWEGRT
jgi:predicted aconitase